MGRGFINDTQLGKSLYNFAGITSHNFDPGGGLGGQSILNLGSHFATLLGLPLTILILEWGWGVNQILNLGSHFATLLGLHLTMLILGGQLNNQLGKSLCNLCWDYFWQCWSGGVWLIDTQLGKSLCIFAGITSDNVDPRWWGIQLTLNLGSHFATLLGLPLTMLILGGWSIDTQLGKFTLQLCWDYLWQFWSWGGWGGQSILNLGSHFATLLGLPLTMLMLGG